jgi:gamma-glutamylcyclotransferase (GGCT)/AIG2-like uncharacterized protein YtfP
MTATAATADDRAVHHVFVYGTLRPGEVRWRHLVRWVVDNGWPDRVGGQLYDTGLDYPAAIFGDGGPIHGQTFALVDESIEECLGVLDVEEDTVGGRYRRVVVTTHAGVRAWAYEYGHGLDLEPIESGDWFRR